MLCQGLSFPATPLTILSSNPLKGAASLAPSRLILPLALLVVRSPADLPQSARSLLGSIHLYVNRPFLNQDSPECLQYPTNTWWAPYAAPPGNATAAGPFPYESALYNNGVVFGISTNRQFDGTSIKQPTQIDWRASFVEHSGNFANHKATGFDTQTVTVQYFQGGATMTAYLVPGSPYMTFQYAGATPLLTSMNGGIQSFNGQTLAVGASGMLYSIFHIISELTKLYSKRDWDRIYCRRFQRVHVPHLRSVIDYVESHLSILGLRHDPSQRRVLWSPPPRQACLSQS